MSGNLKSMLSVAVKSVEALNDELLEHIEDHLSVLEHRLPLSRCRVVIDNHAQGSCYVRLELTLADQRRTSSAAAGSELNRALADAFGAAARA
jgi:hypothetical protein